MRIDWKEFLFKEFPNGKIINSSRGTEYNIDCIFPDCPNPRHHMFINIESNSKKHDKKFVCHRCSRGGNHHTFLIEYFNLPLNEILDNLSDLYGLEETPYSMATKNLQDFSSTLSYEPEEDNKEVIIDLPKQFRRIRENTPYLNNRNFPEWALSGYRIGICKNGYYKDRIIFQIITGKNRSFLAYSQDSKKKLKTYKKLSKKYPENKEFWKKSRKILYPSKSITSILLYNYNKIKIYEPVVVIVEGVMDMIRVISFGYNAVAKLGGFLSDEQCKLLSDKDVGEFVYMPDSDVSERNIIESIDRLKKFCDSDISYVKLKNGDPDDIRSKKEMIRILNHRIRKNKILIKNNDLSLF
jgi:DNA primase